MLVTEKQFAILISLNNYMPLENRKRRIIFPFWECFNQTLSRYKPAENKIRKNKNSKDLLNTKQVFSAWNLENLSGEYGRLKPWLPVWTCVCWTNLPKLQIPEVKAFCLKDKARLSWNMAILEFTKAVVCRWFLGVLKNFTIFTENHLCWSLFLIKLHTWRPATLSKRLLHRCFPVNIVNFLRAAFLWNISDFCFWISYKTCWK